MDSAATEIEVNVIEWDASEPRQVCITLKHEDLVFTISAEAARNLAFMLMECADFIEPPFEAEI